MTLSRSRAHDGGVKANLHAVVRQGTGQYVGRVAFLAGKEFRIVLHDRDMRTEPAKGLRQFAAQRSPADDGEALRQGRHFEDRRARAITS